MHGWVFAGNGEPCGWARALGIALMGAAGTAWGRATPAVQRLVEMHRGIPSNPERQGSDDGFGGAAAEHGVHVATRNVKHPNDRALGGRCGQPRAREIHRQCSNGTLVRRENIAHGQGYRVEQQHFACAGERMRSQPQCARLQRLFSDSAIL